MKIELLKEQLNVLIDDIINNTDLFIIYDKYIKKDDTYIHIRIYNNKNVNTKSILINRYDTLKDTYKFLLGMYRLIRMYQKKDITINKVIKE